MKIGQTKKSVLEEALQQALKPKIKRFCFAKQDEPVDTIIGQCPVDQAFSIEDVLAAYDAEDRKLADRLRTAKSAAAIVAAFSECPCACYAGVRKYLSDKEEKWLATLIAKYLLFVTKAEQFSLLSNLPQRLKVISWNSLPELEQARIKRIKEKRGAVL